MKYMGSKNRIAKELLPLILRKRKENQWYVEPFVGGANMIDKVTGNRIGSDVNEYLIALYKALQNGWVPPETITEEDYKLIKDYKEMYDPALVAFVGFACSYSAKWFGGYCRNKAKDRDYVKEAYRNVLNQSPNLVGIRFHNGLYSDLAIPENSIIYCDPPYEGTTKYRDGFNHGLFWQWCRDKIHQDHSLFVSEYNAPSDFICVWEKSINSSLTKNTGGKKGIEKLFVHESQLMELIFE